MPVIINGSTGISGTDGSAATPALQGTDTNTGMFFPAADQIAFAEGGTEVMRIDASGNVGIGTSSPGANSLTIARGAGVGAAIEVCGNGTSPGVSGITLLQSTASDAYLWNRANSFLSLGANNTERARITADGEFRFNSGYGSVATAFGCRAWVNFDGNGTPTIRASGNVSSITDAGLGTYTVNFATAMPDAFYSAVKSENYWSIGDIFNFNTSNVTLRVYANISPATLIDTSIICVAVFR